MDFKHGAAPNLFDSLAAGLHPQEHRPDPVVGGRNEYQIIHHHRIHRIDRIICRRPKPKTEVHGAIGRI